MEVNNVPMPSWLDRWRLLVRHSGSGKGHFSRKICKTQSNVELVDDPSILSDILGMCYNLGTLSFE